MPIAIAKKKELGEEIKKQRIKVQMTLRAVAKECDIAPASLSDIENGILFPGEAAFLRLVEILRFEDKPKTCDLYAKIKETAPPDVTKFLIDNPDAITKVRQLMQEMPEKEGE